MAARKWSSFQIGKGVTSSQQLRRNDEDYEIVGYDNGVPIKRLKPGVAGKRRADRWPDEQKP